MKNFLKKRMVFLLVLVLLLAVFAGADAEKKPEQKKLTLMVYMCGSNLESRFGSASADIQEMLDSHFNSDEINLLVMTGGAEEWAMGFDAGKTLIHQIGSRGRRVVWPGTDDPEPLRNMAEEGTLKFFLDYCMENYPAEGYALILWDHGGGPMNGVCWDELYSMKNLTLDDVAKAMSYSQLSPSKKLKWIGFDACLMSSVEVACTMAPYADFMIASQEAEPSRGWNYAFLAGLEEDEDGGQTGQRIIDAYFDAPAEEGDTLTLACTDLRKMDILSKSMDDFFQPRAGQMSEESFPRLSSLRMHSAGFGKSAVDPEENALDLVDLKDLVVHLSSEEEPVLLDTLNSAVVYSRSNREGAAGLSVYHPYQNKQKYMGGWMNSYRTIKTSKGYAEYIFRFGSILTAGEMVDWSGLKTRNAGIDGDGVNHFTCTLKPEQANSFVSARLLILDPEKMNNGNGDTYGLTAVCPAVMDDNGVLHASYSGTTLFLENPEGPEDEQHIGPLSYYMTDTENQYVIPLLLQPKETAHLENMQTGLMYFNLEPGSEDVPVTQIRLWDNATGVYTSRMTYREEDYSVMWFSFQQKMFPENNDLGTLPAFSRWPENEYRLHWEGFHLGESWRMKANNGYSNGKRPLAVFEITDAQQNTFCSAPAELINPNVSELVISNPPEEKDMLHTELCGYVIRSEQEKGVEFVFAVTNLSAEKAEVRLNHTILNGKRKIRDPIISDLEPGQTKYDAILVGPDTLMDLTELTSFETEVMYIPDGDRDRSVTRKMEFEIENTDISDLAAANTVLAETEHNGVLWQLQGVTRDGAGQLVLRLHIVNQSGNKKPTNYIIAVNGIYTDPSILTLESDQDQFIDVPINDVKSAGYFDSIESQDLISIFRSVVLSDRLQQRHGFTQIEEITICESQFLTSLIEPFKLHLDQPVPIPEFMPLDQNYYWYGDLLDEDPAETQYSTLIDWPDYAIRAERVFLGDNGLVACLDFENKSDLLFNVELKDIRVDDWSASDDVWFIAMPHSTVVFNMSIQGDPETISGRPVKGFSFTVTGPLQLSDPRVEVSFNDEVMPGVYGGTMVKAADITASAPAFPTSGTEEAVIPTEVTYQLVEYRSKESDEEKWFDNSDFEETITLHQNRTATYLVRGKERDWQTFWIKEEDGSVLLVSEITQERIYREGDGLFLDKGYCLYHLEPVVSQ